MKYKVIFSPAVEKSVLRLLPVDYIAISRDIQSLAEAPRGQQTKKVVGSAYWRLKVGQYRVIYAISDEEKLIYIERVARRNEKTYRGL